MTKDELRVLVSHALKKTAPENYSVTSVNAAVADAISSMTKNYNDFQKNKYDIFQIIMENAEEIIPAKVMDAFGAFAEVLNVANGVKPQFKKGRLGRQRAKKFLTQVGLTGVYESFRLDSETFTIGMKAIGGAVSIDFDRMRDGAESIAEVLDVLVEAQIDAIYSEVQAALMAAVSNANMPARNKVSGGYSATALQNMVNTVKAYGNGDAVIFASPEFVDAMGPDAIVPAIASAAQAVYPQDDINSIHTTGYIKLFRGTPVITFRQSFLDEKNEQKLINPQYAYVLPSGSEKVVKIVREGGTDIWDYTNPDRSVEINTQTKIGVAILAYNNWGVYQNTGITIPGANDINAWYNGSMSLGV